MGPSFNFNTITYENDITNDQQHQPQSQQQHDILNHQAFSPQTPDNGWHNDQANYIEEDKDEEDKDDEEEDSDDEEDEDEDDEDDEDEDDEDEDDEDDDPNLYIDEEDAKAKLTTVLEGMVGQFGSSTTISILQQVTSELKLHTTSSRSQVRAAKFQKQIQIPYLISKLALIEATPRTFPTTLPTPATDTVDDYAANSRELYNTTEIFESLNAAATSAKFAAHLQMADLVEMAHQNNITNEFNTSTMAKLNWTSRKYTAYIKRCKHVKQLTDMTSRGGSTMISFYISGSDIEHIGRKEWDDYLQGIEANSQLVQFLKSVTLAPNHTLPQRSLN